MIAKFLTCCLFLVCACAENVPTNETSEPGAAGAPAVEQLSFGVSAKIRTELTVSSAFFGTRPYCEDPVPGQTSCYTHAAPWTDNGPWYYLIWDNLTVTNASSWVFFAQPTGPAIYMGKISCSQTSCTSIQ
jgi:hypothetical protein